MRAFSILKIEGDTLYFSSHNMGATFQQLEQVAYAEWISMDPQTWTA